MESWLPFFLILIAGTVVLSSITLANFGPSSPPSSQPASPSPAAQPSSPPQQTQPPQQTTQQTALTPSREQNLQCSNLLTVKERVACRIKLTTETELNYLPEECRTLTGLDRAKCIDNYKATVGCFQRGSDTERINCARSAIGLQVATIQQTKLACQGNQTCLDEVKEKVFTLVKFRFYNLEEKAQEMRKYGVSENTVVDFIASLEQKKQKFNDASSIDQKKQIVSDVLNLWNQFVVQAKSEAG